jgi:dTDP-4-dehydrorhamnose 3,5-epimerase
VKFNKTSLAGVFLIEPEAIRDDRGFFARTWCAREFDAAGLGFRIAQTNISFNRKAGTLRGMHYQAEPYPEAKVVSCTHGAIFDVAVDLRPSSPTCGQWFGAELSAENRRAMFLPKDFAHGFQTLEDDSEVHYLMSEFFDPDSGRGVRHDDPAFAIDWPLTVTGLSERDKSWPLWTNDGAFT